MPERIPIFYTFGNHHHWIDFEWLWGYQVTPDSVSDMLRYCRETGAKGNINFDAVGYEKMAGECPEALATLRQAIQEGTIEPVGCSYGQPYGLFHGGESNIRQRIYGVRAVMRLLGYRPRTFWEEEFDFFPQLPQILKACGFEYASLYFQWTWHTPEVPKEDVPVVWWEAPNGSRLLTATRNRFNLHQWPEDFQILLDELASGSVEGWKGGGVEEETPPPPGAQREEAPSGGGGGGLRAQRAAPGSSTHPSVHPSTRSPVPLILQWLELIPSQDWMCRAELMIPMLKKLQEDPRFEVRMGTLGEYLKGIADCGLTISESGNSGPNPKSEIQNPQSSIPVRRYTMDQVWHGMSLGKNGDRMRRKSRSIEHQILKAESLATVNSLFGRPYAQWDVYPTWELEEAWRELLQAQHHDNDECEGLCGRVGEASYERADFLSRKVLERQMSLLASRVPCNTFFGLDYNPLGWPRKSHFDGSVPAFGFARKEPWRRPRGFEIRGDEGWVEDGAFRVCVDLKTGHIRQLWSRDFPDGALDEHVPFPRLNWRQDGKERSSAELHLKSAEIENTSLWLIFEADEHWFRLHLTPAQEIDALDIEFTFLGIKPDPGLLASAKMSLCSAGGFSRLFADTPLSISEVRPTPKGLKKYPEGDWMTSPQWFEEVKDVFTASTLVDLVQGGQETERGLLIISDGNQQWFHHGDRVACVVTMNDPWDEDYFETDWHHFRLVPHGPLANSDRYKLAQEALRWVEHGDHAIGPEEGDLPPAFSPLLCSPSNVVPTAFYREEAYYAGRDLQNYAGKGMGHPFVIRLVEFDGLESDVELTLPGPIAKAFKTNLMGEIELGLEPEAGSEPLPRQASGIDEGGVGEGDPGVAESRNLHPPTPSPDSDSVETGGRGVESFTWQTLRFKLRPYEIATVYADLVPGRKQFRDLDAMRKVWATVHRVED